MSILKRPWEKYEPFIGPDLSTRTWPSQRITKAPRWLATDLRDGNQSLASPMSVSQKWAYFKLLVKLGYKEIEISTPTASTIEYEFTRQVVNSPDEVPDDVWLQVLCPCRHDLIKQTVESLRGAKRAIVSLYYASSPVMLDTVFQMSQQDVYDRVVDAVTYFRSLTKDDPSQQGTRWNLMFSPEQFSASDTRYCVRLCEAAKRVWEPTVEDPIILTLPATVEVATPNVYADQVELFSTLISDRDKVCVGLHVHNDRGCAVAAAELGQMAGAQRVEGCLFGYGERAGNVDLVTLALNLYSQGIDPGVDLSDIASVRAFVEDIIDIKVPPRSPYAGDMIFTAYSGAHQDAINKGLVKFESACANGAKPVWDVPYLPMDPADLGLSRDDIIRVNSQSGKGGVGWTLSHELGVQVPRGLLLQFSQVVKGASVTSGGTISPPDVAKLFLKRYSVRESDPRIIRAGVKPVQVTGLDARQTNGTTNGASHSTAAKAVEALILLQGKQQILRGQGTTIGETLSNVLAKALLSEVVTFSTTMSGCPDTTLVFVECQSHKSKHSTWGVREVRNHDQDTCELLASLSAVLDLLEN